MALKTKDLTGLRMSSKSKGKKVTWNSMSKNSGKIEKSGGNKIFNADDVVDPLNTNTNHILSSMRNKSINIHKSIKRTTQIIDEAARKPSKKSSKIQGFKSRQNYLDGKTQNQLSTAMTLNTTNRPSSAQNFHSKPFDRPQISETQKKLTHEKKKLLKRYWDKKITVSSCSNNLNSNNFLGS